MRALDSSVISLKRATPRHTWVRFNLLKTKYSSQEIRMFLSTFLVPVMIFRRVSVIIYELINHRELETLEHAVTNGRQNFLKF